MDSRLGNGPIETWSCWEFPNEFHLHNNHGPGSHAKTFSHRTDSRGLDPNIKGNNSRRFFLKCTEKLKISLILCFLAAQLGLLPYLALAVGEQEVIHQKQRHTGRLKPGLFLPKLLHKEGHMGSRSASRNMHNSFRYSGSSWFLSFKLFFIIFSNDVRIYALYRALPTPYSLYGVYHTEIQSTQVSTPNFQTEEDVGIFRYCSAEVDQTKT